MKNLKNVLAWVFGLGLACVITVIIVGWAQGKTMQDFLPTGIPTITRPIPTTTDTPTIAPTSTTSPTAIAIPAGTTEPLVEYTEPELPVELETLSPDFGIVHVAIEDIPFLRLNTIQIVEVINGIETTTSLAVYSSSEGSSCQEVSLLDNAKRVYQEAKRQGVDWHTLANGVMGESGYQQFVDDGNSGCKLLQNRGGHPAYCMMQIYLPAHKDVTVEMLKNTDFCIQYGVGVFANFSRQYPNDPVQAMACYKGFCQSMYQGKESPGFISHFMKSYNTSGIEVDGHFIPFDENKLLEMYPDWKVN